MMPSSVAPTRVEPFLAPRRAWSSRATAGCVRCFAKCFARERLQPLAALRQRLVDQRRAVGVGQQIEHDQQRRRLRRELLHAARRRMNALQQRVERERPAVGHHDLAVEHEVLRLERAAPPRPPRENSASAACRTSIAARPCRRRGTPGSGSRPISARTATRGRSGPHRPTGPPWAGTGDAACRAMHRHNADGRLLAGHREKNFELSAVRPRW